MPEWVEIVHAIPSRESTCALPILVSGSEKREPERPKFHPVSPQSVCNSSTSLLQSRLRFLT